MGKHGVLWRVLLLPGGTEDILELELIDDKWVLSGVYFPRNIGRFPTEQAGIAFVESNAGPHGLWVILEKEDF
jgi:hypothetical protein